MKKLGFTLVELWVVIAIIDRFLNPGFGVASNLTPSEYSAIGYTDDTVEFEKASCSAGYFYSEWTSGPILKSSFSLSFYR